MNDLEEARSDTHQAGAGRWQGEGPGIRGETLARSLPKPWRRVGSGPRRSSGIWSTLPRRVSRWWRPCDGAVLADARQCGRRRGQEGDILSEMACAGDRPPGESCACRRPELPRWSARTKASSCCYDAFHLSTLWRTVRHGTMAGIPPDRPPGIVEEFRALVDLADDSIQGAWPVRSAPLPGMGGRADYRGRQAIAGELRLRADSAPCRKTSRSHLLDDRTRAQRRAPPGVAPARLRISRATTSRWPPASGCSPRIAARTELPILILGETEPGRPCWPGRFTTLPAAPVIPSSRSTPPPSAIPC